jgi:hypothetical protein
MDIELIDFLDFDEVLQELKDHAKEIHPDKKFIPFWRLLLRDGKQLVIRATVSDGKIGVPQESVELIRDLYKEQK